MQNVNRQNERKLEIKIELSIFRRKLFRFISFISRSKLDLVVNDVPGILIELVFKLKTKNWIFPSFKTNPEPGDNVVQ